MEYRERMKMKTSRYPAERAKIKIIELVESISGIPGFSEMEALHQCIATLEAAKEKAAPVLRQISDEMKAQQKGMEK
jgi:hypothetical protein